jgi:hypothetical protein
VHDSLPTFPHVRKPMSLDVSVPQLTVAEVPTTSVK